jgi:hypothetical protein
MLSLKIGSLYRGSCSVLLTVCLADLSASHQEAQDLLKKPEAMWSVVTVNSHPDMKYENTVAEHYTPIAQFIRGVASSLQTQRMSAEIIHHACMVKYREVDDGSPFDDQAFTKSHAYHLVVKLCSELEMSLASGLRFISQLLNGDLSKLSKEAHIQETLGLELWLAKLREEISALENLHEQIQNLKSQVHESVSPQRACAKEPLCQQYLQRTAVWLDQSAHCASQIADMNKMASFTAVLDARAAAEQGYRMKILGYLATIYLPITAASVCSGWGFLRRGWALIRCASPYTACLFCRTQPRWAHSSWSWYSCYCSL